MTPEQVTKDITARLLRALIDLDNGHIESAKFNLEYAISMLGVKQ